MRKRREHADDRGPDEREEVALDADADPGALLGTPPPGTRPGGQQAGRLTGAQPAEVEPEDEEA
jgi:hypothetical protein